MDYSNHIIYDIKLKDKILIKQIEKIFDKITDILSLTILKKEKYIFDNGGFTLFYLLAESHISAHYRIENNYLAMDIYSCNEINSKEKEILNIINELNIKDIKVNYLNRDF